MRRRHRKKSLARLRFFIFITTIVIVTFVLKGVFAKDELQAKDLSEEVAYGEEVVYKNVSYYIDERLDRYKSYAEKHPELEYEDIVLDVNMDLDYNFYENIKIIGFPDDLLVLCNKYNQLPGDFKPKNLVPVDAGYHVNDGKKYELDQKALEAFIEMADAAKEDGIDIKIISAYRSNDYQEYLYNKYKDRNGQEDADRYSARPGHSEHETGLAIDINDVSQAFENTDAFKWLSENAHLYGYILRYPKGMEHRTGYIYEPWHYRFVGQEHAKAIKDEGIIFDAYYAKYVLPKN